jgi:hypothetical protein
VAGPGADAALGVAEGGWAEVGCCHPKGGFVVGLMKALSVLMKGAAHRQELPEDTDEIKTLTVEQAKALARQRIGRSTALPQVSPGG